MNRRVPQHLFQLTLLTLLLAACGGNTEPQTRIFDLNIAGGSLDEEHRTLRVDHNDEVVLRITSDREGSFHLHGYDLETPLMPGETAALAFTANQPASSTLRCIPHPLVTMEATTATTPLRAAPPSCLQAQPSLAST